MSIKGDVLQFPDMGQIQMINALINDAEGIDDPNGTIAVALHDSVYRAERLAMDRGEDLLGSIERWIRVLNAASTGPDCPAETALNRGLYAGREYFKAAEGVLTKDMSTLMEVAKLLGQIGTAGAALYVGAGAARETYDALKAKCREMMDKLDDAQRQLDDIDPRELDNEMRSAPKLDETKSFGDIINWLYAGGVAFIGATMLWDSRYALMGRIETALDAFRDALTSLRYGSQMQDLQNAIDTLRAAGVQVPDDIVEIVIDPRNGDSEIPAANLSYARGYLQSAIARLEEAQARAENMPDDGMDKSAPALKSAGAHSFYR